jgi:hypothetical protein
VELGLGDDATVLRGTAPVHYVFEPEGNIDPYVGGGLAVSWVDFDTPSGSDSDVELDALIVGGMQVPLKSGRLFLLELGITLGDVYDFTLMAGWTFR